MRALPAITCVFLVCAAQAATAPAPAFTMPAGLVAEGIPAIPARIVDEVGR